MMAAGGVPRILRASVGVGWVAAGGLAGRHQEHLGAGVFPGVCEMWAVCWGVHGHGLCGYLGDRLHQFYHIFHARSAL